MKRYSFSFKRQWIIWSLGLVVLAAAAIWWFRPGSDSLIMQVLGSNYAAWKNEQTVPKLLSSDVAGGVLSLGTGEHPWQDAYIETRGGEPHLVLDYGELVLGTPVLTLDSKSGGNLNVKYTEQMNGADYQPLTQTNGFSLVAGAQTITDSPRLFRYLEIRFTNHPAATTLKDVTLKDVRQGSRLGYFHSSDEELNNIWRMSARSVELSTASTYIDSPHRDNATWLGDAQQIAWADEFLTGDRKVADATLATFAKRVRPDGAIIAVDHLSPDNHEDWVFLDYLSRFVSMVDDHYIQFRGKAVITQYHDLVDQQLDFLKKHTNSDGLLIATNDLAPANDWSSTKRTGIVAYHQVVYWQALQAGASIAAQLGDTTKQTAYTQQAEALKSAALKQLTDPKTGLLLDFLPQAGVEAPHIPLDANILALDSGWYEPALAQTNVKQLKLLLETPYGWKAVDEPYSHIDGRFDISPMMNAKVVETLLQYGVYDTKLSTESLALTKTVWGHLLDAGTTTAWEFVNAKDGTIAGSISHGWSGLLSRELPEQFVGLSYDDKQPNHYIFNPRLSLVDDFEAAIPTRFGIIAFSSHKENADHIIKIVLPKGTTGELHGPDGLTLGGTLQGGRTYTLKVGPGNQL